MAESARIGDVYRDRPDTGTITEETAYRNIAGRKGHSVWLALGMVDRDNFAYFEVTTPTGKVILPESQLEEVWSGCEDSGEERCQGSRRVSFPKSAEQAQRFNLIRLTAENRAPLVVCLPLAGVRVGGG